MKQSYTLRTVILFIIFLVAIFFGITKGPIAIPIKDLFNQNNIDILHLRVLRVLLAITTGAGLAVCGITLQAILRNPLADPYLLGTSSGAGLGAVIGLTLGIFKIYLPLAAFAGAILTVGIVYFLARRGSRVEIQSLILSGVVVSVALSGVIVFLVSFNEDKALHNLMWWLWGSLQIYDIKLLSAVSLIVLTGTVSIYALSQDLNALSLGEDEALHLGVETELIKTLLIIITSLMTAAVVCVSGIIGFVGLIIPHATRLLVGPNHKILIPASCALSAAFLILCDLISRTIAAPFEIPIGVITACIGAPLFITILKVKEKVQ
ncbi:MAG TPA: iron ABC transporter permease [Candidatus Omnitrophota bacterium]|nr:iron ABC transporter permease [Candidatus Omnitrophota bacterium]